ncbi:hypothetical protein [Eubacterium pyruvativorans]|uniref:gp33 family protein n=1 Tax=Eubacterium pyruvativorans TaxID=155865 RepID=UPI0030B8E020
MDQTNEMFLLADRLKSLREEKKQTDAHLKVVNASIKEVDQKLSDLMAVTETQNFTHAGTMFSLTSKVRASAVSDRKEDLYQALRDNGYGSMVTETVNANSLSSFVKEQREENEDELPTWLDGLVNVFDQITVGVRKARK